MMIKTRAARSLLAAAIVLSPVALPVFAAVEFSAGGPAAMNIFWGPSKPAVLDNYNSLIQGALTIHADASNVSMDIIPVLATLRRINAQHPEQTVHLAPLAKLLSNRGITPEEFSAKTPEERRALLVWAVTETRNQLADKLREWTTEGQVERYSPSELAKAVKEMYQANILLPIYGSSPLAEFQPGFNPAYAKAHERMSTIDWAQPARSEEERQSAALAGRLPNLKASADAETASGEQLLLSQSEPKLALLKATYSREKTAALVEDIKNSALARPASPETLRIVDGLLLKLSDTYGAKTSRNIIDALVAIGLQSRSPDMQEKILRGLGDDLHRAASPSAAHSPSYEINAIAALARTWNNDQMKALATAYLLREKEARAPSSFFSRFADRIFGGGGTSFAARYSDYLVAVAAEKEQRTGRRMLSRFGSRIFGAYPLRYVRHSADYALNQLSRIEFLTSRISKSKRDRALENSLDRTLSQVQVSGPTPDLSAPQLLAEQKQPLLRKLAAGVRQFRRQGKAIVEGNKLSAMAAGMILYKTLGILAGAASPVGLAAASIMAAMVLMPLVGLRAMRRHHPVWGVLHAGMMGSILILIATAGFPLGLFGYTMAALTVAAATMASLWSFRIHRPLLGAMIMSLLIALL